MCDLAEGLVTFVGPAEGMAEVLRGWDRLRTVRSFYLERLEIANLEALETQRPMNANAPMIGRLRHKWQPGSPVAERLQAEMILNRIPVMVETEHHIGLCAGFSDGWTSRSASFGRARRLKVELDARAIDMVASDVPPGSAQGSRVAVIDSGDLQGKVSMTDFTGGLAGHVQADDLIGHGTAVSEVIRQLSARADVTALRVVNAQRGTSYEVLCAMTYALWSEMFDVINVSISAQTRGPCMTVLGGSLDLVLDICEQQGVRIPKIVAAAGNTTTGQAFGYPARLPGTTVVQAWDFDGRLANYNVTVPDSHQLVHATGGVQDQALGTITEESGAVQPVFGTSFAAAVATARMVG